MRILSVAEINMRAFDRFRVVSPPPPRDPVLPRYLEEEAAADAEVAAILNSSSPINVAPLVAYAEYGLPLQPLFPDLGPTPVEDDDVDNNDNDGVHRAWQAQEEEELAARAMARQAEARAEDEENARVRLLREAEEEEEEEEPMDEEEARAEEEEEDEVMDSGVDSDSSSSSSNNSSGSDEDDAPYDPVRDPEREARLHRLLGVHKRLWTVRQKLLRLERKRDLTRLQERINRVRGRRTRHMRSLTREQRRRLPKPQVERPRRNRDSCYGCGRFYLVQRVRWWWRCDTCGLWLCPDCSADTLHCQRNELI